MIDLTNIGQASQQPQNTPVVTPTENNKPEENLRVPDNSQAKAFRKDHWTPDKFVQDGQVRAGDVDEEHEEFLKNTEWVK